MACEVVHNAVQCKICGAGADHFGGIYRCQANPAHMGDTLTGLFSDLSHPGDVSACEPREGVKRE